jgi:hypothetical protein
MYNKNIMKAIEEISKYKDFNAQTKALDELASKYGVKIEVVEALPNGIKLFRIMDQDGLVIGEYHALTPQWGGYREGSGRKPTGRHKVYMNLTDDEEVKLRAYLEELRTKK